jgi:hypothetical protein
MLKWLYEIWLAVSCNIENGKKLKNKDLENTIIANDSSLIKDDYTGKVPQEQIYIYPDILV